MAFVTPITASNGRLYPAAYCNLVLLGCDKHLLTAQIRVWETSEARKEYPDTPCSLLLPIDLPLPDERALVADNPIDCGYKLLEVSGKYPEATWNI